MRHPLSAGDDQRLERPFQSVAERLALVQVFVVRLEPPQAIACVHDPFDRLVGVVQRPSDHSLSCRKCLLRVLRVDGPAFFQRDALQIRRAVPVPLGRGAVGDEDVHLVAGPCTGALLVGMPSRVADHQQVDVALGACGPLGDRPEQHDLLRIGRRDDLVDGCPDSLFKGHSGHPTAFAAVAFNTRLLRVAVTQTATVPARG